MKTLTQIPLIAFAFGLMPALSMASIQYSFYSVSNNNAINVANGISQLSVTVSDAAGGMNLSSTQAKFTFNNVGSNAMSITDVYFDDGTLLGIASIMNGAGVSFSQGASPPNLPSGNNASPPFQTTAGFLADSDPPAQPNGVNPGETLAILFNLINGKTLADTYAALAQGGGTDGLRVGIHVQGYSNGGSEAFVNSNPVPEPGTIAVWGLLAVAGYFGVKKYQAKA